MHIIALSLTAIFCPSPTAASLSLSPSLSSLLLLLLLLLGRQAGGSRGRRKGWWQIVHRKCRWLLPTGSAGPSRPPHPTRLLGPALLFELEQSRRLPTPTPPIPLFTTDEECIRVPLCSLSLKKKRHRFLEPTTFC